MVAAALGLLLLIQRCYFLKNPIPKVRAGAKSRLSGSSLWEAESQKLFFNLGLQLLPLLPSDAEDDDGVLVPGGFLPDCHAIAAGDSLGAEVLRMYERDYCLGHFIFKTKIPEGDCRLCGIALPPETTKEMVANFPFGDAINPLEEQAALADKLARLEEFYRHEAAGVVPVPIQLAAQPGIGDML